MEVDVSSYKSPQPAPKSLVETMGQYQSFERGNVALQREKLDLINTNYSRLITELNSLPPTATADDMRRVAQNAVKLKLITPEMASEFSTQIPTDPNKIPAFKQETVGKLMSTMEAVNFHLGQPSMIDNGQSRTPVRTPLSSGAPVPTGMPIQTQLPPSTAVRGEGGTPTLQGPTPAQVPPGSLPVQRGLPGQFDPNAPMRPNVVPTSREAPVAARPRLPVQNFGESVIGAGGTPPAATPAATVANRFPAPSGPAVGLAPGEETEIKGDADALNSDRQNATVKLQGTIPLKEAINLIPLVTTGIGTDTFNRGRAGLINLGLIKQTDNDPTVIYQALNKALGQYIQRSGLSDRSDAQQALAESSNPNARTQIQPALLKVAREAVALDRIEAARALSWDKATPVGYGRHRSSFPQSIDPKAFSIDFLPASERASLIMRMQRDLKGNSSEKREAQKFWKSLELADRLGIISVPE